MLLFLLIPPLKFIDIMFYIHLYIYQYYLLEVKIPFMDMVKKKEEVI